MAEQTAKLYREKHRPQFHFTPAENWLNDPNGMVFYNGVYHLFYQYNPSDKVWGDMNWAHASSTDLVYWAHRPVALHSERDGLGYIFSGSAVVDWRNTSGLQNGDHPPLVAMFSQSSKHDHQVQSLAYSVDGGDHWMMYPHNPVIANPGIDDFRDPKIFWHDRSEHWVMVLAAGQCIQFYRSKNLIEWGHLYDFRENFGASVGVWECPDLFPLTLKRSGAQQWVLLASLNPGDPGRGSPMQYFIGDFDGQTFRPDHTEMLWLDYGPDNFAGVTWSDVPDSDGRRIMIGWMGNWHYSGHLPTAPWRGAMTVPRELALLETERGLRLGSQPIRELNSLRVGAPIRLENIVVDKAFDLSQGVALGETLDIEITTDWSESNSDQWLLRFYNTQGEALILDCKAAGNELSVDRSRAAYKIDHLTSFMQDIAAPLDLGRKTEICLRILKDTSSIEVFMRDGRSLLTVTYFVDQPLDQLEIYSGHSDIPLLLKSATIYTLDGIW